MYTLHTLLLCLLILKKGMKTENARDKLDNICRDLFKHWKWSYKNFQLSNVHYSTSHTYRTYWIDSGSQKSWSYTYSWCIVCMAAFLCFVLSFRLLLVLHLLFGWTMSIGCEGKEDMFIFCYCAKTHKWPIFFRSQNIIFEAIVHCHKSRCT